MSDPVSVFIGLTLRDLFAAHALAGQLAHPETSGIFEEVAIRAYRYADTMLAVRAVPPPVEPEPNEGDQPSP